MVTADLIIGLLNSVGIGYLLYQRWKPVKVIEKAPEPERIRIPPQMGSTDPISCFLCQNIVSKFNSLGICANCEAGNL